MKRLTASLAALGLVGCQTTLDPNYAIQLESYRLTITSQQNVEMAKARAEEARYNAIAAVAERADSASKQMAIFALALLRGGDVQVRNVEVQLPRIPETSEDRALKWASVIVPTVATLGLGYWGYKTAVQQSNNQAATTQSSYAALVGMKPVPIDFTKIPPQTVTTTTTNIRNDTDVTNRDGFVVVGAQAPTNPTQDNRVTTPAPVVITPVVPIVPVVTGP